MSLTAKDFHNPLLRTLGRLSDWKTNQSLPFKDTFGPVMAIMGIHSLEEHGINRSSGQPNVVKWIQWAFKNLKGQGLTTAPSRGRWALSEEGLVEARRLNQLVVKEQPIDNVPLPVPQQAEFQGYHPDPYIVYLGARSTPCFSHFTSRSPICKSCPLLGDCKDATWAAMSALSRSLV